MFSTLESSWDRSARRGWSAIASFTFQTMALSLLVAIPMFWVQGPPRLQWLQPLMAPITQMPLAPTPVTHQRYSGDSVSNPINNPFVEPRYIPRGTPRVDDQDVGPAPEIGNAQLRPGVSGTVPFGLGTGIPIVTPRPPATALPLKISHWAEGNLIYRV